jgi:hypothetical protein
VKNINVLPNADKLYPKVTSGFLVGIRSLSQPENAVTKIVVVSATPSIKPIIVGLKPRVLERNRGRDLVRISLEQSFRKETTPNLTGRDGTIFILTED